jgi:hypothetical protein
MAIQSWIHECAGLILGVDEIPLDLRNYLDDVEMYANLAAGTIASRQVVAIALASYTRIRKLELKLGPTSKEDDSPDLPDGHYKGWGC